MKRILYTMIAAAITVSASAQSAYEAANAAVYDLNGTARFVGMGGALSALGSDITTMGTNPAGTGLFRRNETAFTFGGVFTDAKGQLNNDAGKPSFDQAGIIFSLPLNSQDVTYVNMGVNYTKARNFLQNIGTGINLGGLSQTNQIVQMAADWVGQTNCDIDEMGSLIYSGISSYEDSPLYRDDIGNTVGVVDVISDGESPSWHHTFYPGKAEKANYTRYASGNNSMVDINISTNIQNKVFIGASVGIHSLSYSRTSVYNETGYFGYDSKATYYELTNNYNSNGDGVDIKLGVIYRPIEDSGFRIGVSVHTPTWYSIRETNSYSIGNTVNGIYRIEDSYVADEFRYRLRTPWKFNFSLGHTIGSSIAIGAEYEYQDNSTCKYSRDYDYEFSNIMQYNENNRLALKGQHTVRLGFEYKPIKEFSVRVGYNYISSPFKNVAYYSLPYYSPYAETDYINWKGTNRFTIGMGYRFKNAYIDLAYQLQEQKGDLYAFYQNDGKSNSTANMLSPTSVNNSRSQIMATLGFRF